MTNRIARADGRADYVPSLPLLLPRPAARRVRLELRGRTRCPGLRNYGNVSVAIVSRQRACGVERRSLRRPSAAAATGAKVRLAAWDEAKDDRGRRGGE